MSSDERARLLDAATGAIAGEVVGAIKRKTENSAVARILRDRLGIDQSNQKTKDLVARALADAAYESGASSGLVKRFAEHPENLKAIAELVTDPDAEPAIRTTMAIGPQERKQLQILARNLPNAVRQAIELQISPEGRRILGAVTSAKNEISGEVQSEHQETRDLIEQLFDERLPTVPASVLYAGTVVELSRAEETLTTIATRITAAEKAKKQGRHADAEREAKRVVAEHEGKGQLNDDERDELRRAHRVLADLYIANPNTSSQAVPHLEAILRHWDGNPEGRLTNRAILRLLSGDHEDALRFANEALGLDASNEGARSVKANVLVRLGHADEAAALYDGDAPTTLSMRAWLLRMGNQFGPAREVARAVLVDVDAPRESRILAAQVFAETTLLEFAPLYEYGAKPRQSEVHDVLLEAIRYLDQLLTIVDEQRPAVRADALLYRASLIEWTGQRGARDNLEEAVTLQPNNERALRNLVVLLTSHGEYVRAAEIAERVLDIDSSPEATRLAISVTMQAGNFQAAVARLEPLAADPSASPDAAEAAIMLAESYASLFRTSAAEAILDDVEAGGHAPLGVLHARIRQAYRAAQDPLPLLEVAVAHPEPAGNSEQGRRELGRWRLAQLMLGDALLSSGDSERAAMLLAPFIDPEVPDSSTLRYTAALLNTGKNAECLEVCNRALAALSGDSGGSVSGLAVEFEAVAAAVHMNLDAFVDADERYSRILPGRPERTRDLVAWGTALIRLGQPNRALDVLRLAEARVAEDPAKLAVVGNAYAEAGDMSRALDLAYRALDLAPNDERFHRNFAGLFLTHGDEITAAGPLDEKYLDRFHSILHNYATQFPDAPPFVWMEQIPEDQDEMIRKLVELVRPRHEAHKAIRERLLRGGDAPLSTLADLLGRNQVEVWEAVTSNPEWGRHAFPGNHPARGRSVAIAQATGVIVATPSALLTLYGLGLLREALGSFDEVLVPQAFIDELHHALDLDRTSLDGTRLYMGLNEDGRTLSITEVSAEVAYAQRSHVQDLYDALTKDATDPAGRICRIVGRPLRPPGPIAGNDLERFLDLFGDAAEAALVAEAQDLPLLADGIMIRSAVEQWSIQTTDSYGVLERLNDRGVLVQDQFEDARLQLATWGYRYVSVAANTLLRAVVRERGLLTSRSRLVFDYLVQEASEPLSSTNVVSSFLLALWCTDIDGPLSERTVRKQWTALAFDTLARLASPTWALEAIVGVRGQYGKGISRVRDTHEFTAAIQDAYRLWRDVKTRRPRPS